MSFWDEWKGKVLPKTCQGCNRAQIIIMKAGKSFSAQAGCQHHKNDRDRRRCFNSNFEGYKY